MILSERERSEIEAEIARSFNPRAASIGALRAVQAHRGWVSDEALVEVAGMLGLSPAELESVATFYSLIYRRPVGRKVLLVCDSMVCWSLGAESLLAYLERRLGVQAGETTADGEFTLLRVACLGDCDHAPCLMLNQVQVPNVDEAVLDRILSGEMEFEG
jgi:NADH-quinone oxidoreductase subunit E